MTITSVCLKNRVDGKPIMFQSAGSRKTHVNRTDVNTGLLEALFN